MGVFSLWGSVRKMPIYNVKEISILKSLISQLNMKKLGFFSFSDETHYHISYHVA